MEAEVADEDEYFDADMPLLIMHTYWQWSHWRKL